MGFSQMLELLQTKDKGYIVLVNSGSFYIAGGKDAVVLNRILGLKVNCLEPEVCKVGFPINSLEKYMAKIEECGYSYIAYKYDNNEKLEIIKKYTGQKFNTDEEKKLNCYICSNTFFFEVLNLLHPNL